MCLLVETYSSTYLCIAWALSCINSLRTSILRLFFPLSRESSCIKFSNIWWFNTFLISIHKKHIYTLLYFRDWFANNPSNTLQTKKLKKRYSRLALQKGRQYICYLFYTDWLYKAAVLTSKMIAVILFWEILFSKIESFILNFQIQKEKYPSKSCWIREGWKNYGKCFFQGYYCAFFS